MGDKTTSAKLIMNGDFSKLEESIRDPEDWSMNGESYIVVTEDYHDFDNMLKIFDKKLEDMPIVNTRYYSKEFMNDNLHIIKDFYKGFLVESLSEDEREEWEAYINDYDNNPYPEGADLSELERFASMSWTYNNDGKCMKYPNIEDFKGFPEKAFLTEKKRAFVFKTQGTYNIPAYCLGCFDRDPENSSYYSEVCKSVDIWKHFDSERFYDIWHEEIEQIQQEGINGSEEEPEVVFAFG